MSEQLSQRNQQAIQKLEKATAVTDVKIDRLTQDISEIKNNHLLHINNQLLTLNKVVSANQTLTTTLITDKINEVYSRLTELKINDARAEPNNNILSKVIEYIILAVVAGGVAFLYQNKG